MDEKVKQLVKNFESFVINEDGTCTEKEFSILEVNQEEK
jgi:hypothetical protein